MAANKINSKKKDDKSKLGRSADAAIEESEEIDFSMLRKPIPTSITGFAQARKIFDMATEELKGLLSTECDVIYECKVCRNMFRSLANFISHKRVFCKEKFSSSVHGHFVKETSVINEVLKIKKLEESYQESLTEKVEISEEDDSRIPITKDLTSIIEKITMNKGLQQSEVDNKQMVFQKIPKSSVAVFQNLEDDTERDTMKAQVDELNNILSQENAVLQSDGSFKVQSSNKIVQNDDKDTQNADNVIQISDDDENEDSDILKCKICDLQFSTLKTLKFHMKYKHLENRLVYPCPDCLDIFSTSWSVYRHLFKVHRKTAAQIRRLRESIQAKAFRMNNPPAFYEKRKALPKTLPMQKITEEERLHKENQAWLEELDGESEGRRCGGCGRTFERRAALAAHTHTCARRHRRRIQIQIRKDYHKEPNNPYLTLAGAAHTPADVKPSIEDSQTVDKKPKDKEEDTKLEKEENDDEPPEADPLTPEVKNQVPEEMETDEPVIQNKPKFYDVVRSLINNIPFAQQIEKNNLNAFRQKIGPDVDLLKLLCKKCGIKHAKMEDFLDHMSSHYKWVRYACKLCNFKHFAFAKLPEHVRIVHKLKGNTDFYHSTVKAVDSAEALELSEFVEEQNEASETSPDSRRPSRCSSDSSRVSDDSSSSSTRPETGSRKRKSNIYKTNAKKKRDTELNNHKDDILIAEDTATNKITFEENSSDFDEVEEKNTKLQHNATAATVASRRPVRKKTKPKNSDFEYDLSNLLKMEAQGYRDSQMVCNKTTSVSKKKTQEVQTNYDVINKDCCGAMITLSRKSVEIAQGHMKIASFPVFKTAKDSRISSIFARPMVPRVTKEKNSPKKVESEELNSISSPSKIVDSFSSLSSINKDLSVNSNTAGQPKAERCEINTQAPASIIQKSTDSFETNSVSPYLNELNKNVEDDKVTESILSSDKDKTLTLDNYEIVTKPVTETEKVVQNASVPTSESVQTTIYHSTKSDNNTKPESNSDKTKPNLNVVPIKFHRQGLDVIKNPIIKKNITDFTKAGMKTKILVIKPINRKADGTHNLNSPLKFQTIKLKDPRKCSTINEEKKSNPVVVVQVPKVDGGITRPLPTNSVVNNGISPVIPDSSVNVEKERPERDGLSNAPTSNEDEEAPHYGNNIDDKMLKKNSEEKNAQNDQTKLGSDQVLSGCENTYFDANKKMTDKILEVDNEINFDQADQVTSEYSTSEYGKTSNCDKNLSDANSEKSCVEPNSELDQVIDESARVNTELIALDNHNS